MLSAQTGGKDNGMDGPLSSGGLAAQLAGPKRPASVSPAAFPSWCRWPSPSRRAVFTLTHIAAVKASAHRRRPFSILARSLEDVSAITRSPRIPPPPPPPHPPRLPPPDSLYWSPPEGETRCALFPERCLSPQDKRAL